MIKSEELKGLVAGLGYKAIKVYCNKSTACILIDSETEISANDCQIVAERVRSTLCCTEPGIRKIEVSSAGYRSRHHATLKTLCGTNRPLSAKSVRLIGLRQSGTLRSATNINGLQLIQLFDNQSGSIVLSCLALNLVSLKLLNINSCALV